MEKFGSVKYIKKIIKFFTKTRMQIKFDYFAGFKINMYEKKEYTGIIVGRPLLIVKRGFKTKISLKLDSIVIENRKSKIQSLINEIEKGMNYDKK